MGNIIALILGVVMAGCAHTIAVVQAPEESSGKINYELQKRSVVRVYFSDQKREKPAAFYSTGICIRGNRILTAKHNVEGGGRVNVTFYDGRIVPAQVALIAEDAEIAFLRIQDECVPVPVSLAVLRTGDNIHTIGHPFFESPWTVHFGKVAKEEGMFPRHVHTTLKHTGKLLQLDMTATSGFSGGPLFAQDKVVGLIVAIMGDADKKMSGIVLAVPSSVICKYTQYASCETSQTAQ